MLCAPGVVFARAELSLRTEIFGAIFTVRNMTCFAAAAVPNCSSSTAEARQIQEIFFEL